MLTVLEKVVQRPVNKFLFDIPTQKLDKKEIALRQIQKSIKKIKSGDYSFDSLGR